MAGDAVACGEGAGCSGPGSETTGTCRDGVGLRGRCSSVICTSSTTTIGNGVGAGTGADASHICTSSCAVSNLTTSSDGAGAADGGAADSLAGGSLRAKSGSAEATSATGIGGGSAVAAIAGDGKPLEDGVPFTDGVSSFTMTRGDCDAAAALVRRFAAPSLRTRGGWSAAGSSSSRTGVEGVRGAVLVSLSFALSRAFVFSLSLSLRDRRGHLWLTKDRHR